MVRAAEAAKKSYQDACAGLPDSLHPTNVANTIAGYQQAEQAIRGYSASHIAAEIKTARQISDFISHSTLDIVLRLSVLDIVQNREEAEATAVGPDGKALHPASQARFLVAKTGRKKLITALCPKIQAPDELTELLASLADISEREAVVADIEQRLAGSDDPVLLVAQDIKGNGYRLPHEPVPAQPEVGNKRARDAEPSDETRGNLGRRMEDIVVQTEQAREEKEGPTGSSFITKTKAPVGPNPEQMILRAEFVETLEAVIDNRSLETLAKCGQFGVTELDAIRKTWLAMPVENQAVMSRLIKAVREARQKHGYGDNVLISKMVPGSEFFRDTMYVDFAKLAMKCILVKHYHELSESVHEQVIETASPFTRKADSAMCQTAVGKLLKGDRVDAKPEAKSKGKGKTNKTTGKEDKRCHFCNRYGHIKSECRIYKLAVEQKAKDKDGSGP